MDVEVEMVGLDFVFGVVDGVGDLVIREIYFFGFEDKVFVEIFEFVNVL